MIKVTAPVRIDISAGWSDADPFRSDFGGAVLNAAINLRVNGILDKGKLTTSLEKVPSNSGLGTSGALRAVYLVASNPSLIKNKVELIKRVNTFENAIVGQRAGFQDQAAAIFGGVNFWEFRKDGSIKRFPVSKNKAEHFCRRAVLVFTGDRHLSSNVHEKVFENGNYIKRIYQIKRMSVIAKEMYKDFANESRMAELMNETWMLQKTLHKDMESASMEKLVGICNDCYLAARATGAGGGGCMLFYIKPEKKRTFIRMIKELAKQRKGMRILPFDIDYKGINLSGR